MFHVLKIMLWRIAWLKQKPRHSFWSYILFWNLATAPLGSMDYSPSSWTAVTVGCIRSDAMWLQRLGLKGKKAPAWLTLLGSRPWDSATMFKGRTGLREKPPAGLPGKALAKSQEQQLWSERALRWFQPQHPRLLAEDPAIGERT